MSGFIEVFLVVHALVVILTAAIYAGSSDEDRRAAARRLLVALVSGLPGLLLLGLRRVVIDAEIFPRAIGSGEIDAEVGDLSVCEPIRISEGDRRPPDERRRAASRGAGDASPRRC